MGSGAGGIGGSGIGGVGTGFGTGGMGMGTGKGKAWARARAPEVWWHRRYACGRHTRSQAPLFAKGKHFSRSVGGGVLLVAYPDLRLVDQLPGRGYPPMLLGPFFAQTEGSPEFPEPLLIECRYSIVGRTTKR